MQDLTPILVALEVSVAALDQHGGFSIFEVLAIGIVFGCGVLAIAIIHPQTLFTSLGVFIPGCALPVIAYRIFWALADKPEPLPICQKRRCKATRYRIERRTEEGDYYRCSCGDLYLLTPDEHFKFVGPDGLTQPYRCRYYHHGPWRPTVELLDLDKYR